MGSPPATSTRSPCSTPSTTGPAATTSVCSRSSGPSSASAPMAVISFWFDAGRNRVSGLWTMISPMPSA
ncbi:MAG: hypothetical protein R2699_00505 [Acidimicrobiales bacterium]